MAKKKKEALRREKNFGSVYQNKYGKWIGVADLGKDDNGKRIRKQIYYGNSEQEANEAVEKANKQKLILSQEIFTNSFCDRMLDWLLNIKSKTIKSRSLENLMILFNNHIKPYLKNMEIYEVNLNVLQSLLKRIKGKEPRRKTKYLLNQFFDYAVVGRLVEYNPILSINIKDKEDEDVLKKEKEEFKAIKHEYREKFFTALNNHEFLKSLCLTAYYSGLRIGELLGLRWQDIDFKEKTLRIEHAITFKVEYDEKGNKKSKETILSSTKTKSSKTKLPMSNALIMTLKEWEKQQKHSEIKNKIALTGNKNFVFCNEKGEMRTYYGTRKIFKEFLKNNNLQDCGIHFHAIRHTFGDVLRENNWSIYDIQKMLRHSKASTTEIYLSMEHNPALKLQKEIDDVFDKDINEKKDKKRNKDFEM